VSDDLSIPNPSAYRARRHGRHGLDTGTKRLLYIAGGLGAVVVTVVAATLLTGRGGGEVPVIQADSRPLRTKPDNPGGLQIAGSGADTFSGGDTSGAARLAPAAETPDPKALRTAPAHGTEQPNAAALQAMKPEIVPNPPLAAKPSAVAPSAVAPPAVNPAAGTPATAPSATAAPAKPAAPIQAQMHSPAQPQAKPAPAAASSESRAPGAARTPVVQLAALSSEAAAKTEWNNLRKRMPDLLNSRQPVYAKTERDGRTFWRVRTTGFSDLNEAKNFCERVRAKGAACTVAEL